MAEKNKKDPTPPPLLLMPASEGLTLNPSTGNNVLMPVPLTDSSLFGPEEVGEADSFIGQSPPQQAPYSFLNSSPASDPFANVRQPDPFSTPPRHTPTPPNTSQQQPPPPHHSSTPYSHAPPISTAASPIPSQHQPRMVAPPAVPPQPGSMVAAPGGLPIAPPGGGMGMMMTPPTSDDSNQFRMKGGPRRAFATNNAPMGGGFGGLPGMSPMHAPPPMADGTIPLAGGPPPMCAPPPIFPSGPPQGPPLGSFQEPMARGHPPPPPVTSGTAPSPSYGSPVMSPSGLMSPSFMAPSLGAFTPVVHHWFYCKNVELRQLWCPFSISDSIKLEEAFTEGHSKDKLVSVEGGRYDVNMESRNRNAVFWEENASLVRRCSWFYKTDGDSRFVPYDEVFAERLEEEYKAALSSNTWHKKIEMDGETIIMHNANVIVHFKSQPDEWGTVQGDAARPRVVKRGIDEFPDIEDGEMPQIDHVVLIVHGIGSTCDLRFRNIVECVDDFRNISHQIMSSHFKAHQLQGRIGRVEFLPIRWHAALHGDATGIDRKLKAITLKSIGKLRHFTNDTLLDILFYASPAYSQQIIQTVGEECNRLYRLFLSRNPQFGGSVSVAGHSLGALILFDLLSNQGQEQQNNGEGNQEQSPLDTPHSDTSLSRENTPGQDDSVCSEVNTSDEQKEEAVKDEVTLQSLFTKLSLAEYTEAFEKEQVDMGTLAMLDDADLKDMGLPMGPRKKLQGYLKLQKNKQKRRKEEAERLARQEAERLSQQQVQKAAAEFAQKQAATASRNPLLRDGSNTSVGYVVASSGTGLPLVKYPVLDFNPVNFFALGSPVAMFQTVRGVEMLGDEYRLPTCSGFFNIFHPFDPVAYRMEPLISAMYPPKPVLMPHHKGRKRLHLELKESLSRMGSDLKQRIVDSVKITWKTINDFALAHRSTPNELTDHDVDSAISQIAAEQDQDETASIASSMQEDDILVGYLNSGRRIDYVLQEKPIESFNDYLFALGSHACYWESEDTILMILKEIYALMGVSPAQPGQLDQGYGASSPAGFGSQTNLGSVGSAPGGPVSIYGALPGSSYGPQGSYSSQQKAYPPNVYGNFPTSVSAPGTTYDMSHPSMGMGPPPPTSMSMGMGLPPMRMPSPLPRGAAPLPTGPPPPMSGFTPHNGPPPISGFIRK